MGARPVFAKRVSWALLGLDRAGLVERVRRAVYRLTAEGASGCWRGSLRALMTTFFRTYPAFVDGKDRERSQPAHIQRPQPRGDESRETPEETLDRAAERNARDAGSGGAGPGAQGGT